MPSPHRRARILAHAAPAVALVALLHGCGGGEPKPEPAATLAAAPPPVTVPPVTASSASAAAVDPGPRFTQSTGTLEPRRLPAVDLPVVTSQVDGGHLYLWAKSTALPDDALLRAGTPGRLVCRLAGARHGVAVPFDGGGPSLALRLVGAAPPAESLAVTCAQSARLPVAGDDGSDVEAFGATQTYRIVATRGGDRKPARAPFFKALATWLRDRTLHDGGRADPMFEFMAARAERLADGDVSGRAPRAPAGGLRPRRGDLGELMSLYTGLTSAEEALQTDRGLLVREDPKAELKARRIPLATLTPVPLPSHPWAAMIAEKKLTPAIEPLASIAPADAIYVHFGDMRQLVRLMKDVDAWLAPAARALEMSPGEWDMAGRYERELAVERTGLAEKLGHLAVKGVAVVLGDPLLREGTDVAMLFDVGNEALLDGALAAFAANARARRPDAVTGTITLAGRPVAVLSTTDGEIRQHRLRVGNVEIIANAPEAVVRILEAIDGKRPSMARSGDYQYFRGLYPHRTGRGFAFLSDAFVGRVTGPAFKIAAARRMAAAADLKAVAGAALLHGLLEGQPAADAAALLKTGLAGKTDFVHGDGTPITYMAEAGPSSTWGRLTRRESLSAVSQRIDTVSEAEKLAYDAFRDSYQQYWRAFIDPIGVEIEPSTGPGGGGWRVDARMMPLIDASEYDELAALTGRGTIPTPTTPDGVHWRVALGPESRLRREIENNGRHFPGMESLTLSWLGDWFAVGLLDRSAVWDAVLAENDAPAVRRETRGGSSIETLARLPLYGELHLRDRLAFAAFLTALRGAVDQTTGGIVEWGDGGKHRDVPIVTLRERSGGVAGVRGLALHYAIAGQVFILGLDRDAVAARIDAALAPPAPDADSRPPTQAALQLTPGPGAFTFRALAAVGERASERAHRAALRAAELLMAAHPGLDAAGLERRGQALLGYVPVSPYGGGFVRDAEGALTHGLVGSEVRPTVPPSPMPDAPLTRFFEHLAGLESAIAVEGDGAHRGLRVGLTWRTR